jgi:type IV secretion system protein VirB4
MDFFIKFRDALSFRPFRENSNKLKYFCPWSVFCGKPDEGIVLLKTGALMRTYSYVCPDLGSASVDSIASVSWLFNQAVKSLGSGWALHFESVRFRSDAYPGSNWDNAAGYLVDRRRNELFTDRKTHFVNVYYLSLTRKLPDEILTKTVSLLYKKQRSAGNGYYDRDIITREIQNFRDSSQAFVSYFSHRISVSSLDDNETASFLHSTVSSRRHPAGALKRPCFIDSFITDDDLETASTLKLGDSYLPIIVIKNFPSETYPAMLQILNSSEIEYRWVIRWIARSKEESAKDIERYQKRFYGSRKSWGTAIMETVGNYESGREDPAAFAFEQDTNEAKVELSSDAYSFGYFTACLAVWDEDYPAALDKARYAVSLFNSSGFTAKQETFNPFQCFLAMQPGNTFARVDRPVLSSGNLSHIVSLSSVWQGMARNKWTEECFGCAAPLLVCSTASKTPFFLNLNVGDVGHAFIFGPAGAGKSTLIALIASQFLKYRNANVIILDKDKTARSVTMAAGGVYEEPGSENIAFQPLRELESVTDIMWAAEFVKCLLEMQGIKTDAVMSEAIITALRQIRDQKEPGRRNISTFQQYVNYTNPHTGINDIRVGVQPYTVNGQYGAIFDACETKLSLSKWIMIETGTLMKLGAQAVTPALMFIFRFIERVYTKPDGNWTGDPTLLVLDEAWVFLDNDYFSRTIEEWLVTLRKKRVFCLFATQEVAKAAKSRINTTIVSQCQTKIYLADPSAATEVIAVFYRQFGLEEHEIVSLSQAVMKRDYLYKSVNGVRLFELNLDPFQLALLTPDHNQLDALEKKYGRNSRRPLATEILEAKGFRDYKNYFSQGVNYA